VRRLQRQRLMRLVIATLFVLGLVCAPAGARPHKRAQAKRHSAPIAHVVPNDRSAQEHARAEAELGDLRAGRVSQDAAPAEPQQVWAIQENDREVPAPLRKK
jgi:hypothetical protein